MICNFEYINFIFFFNFTKFDKPLFNAFFSTYLVSLHIKDLPVFILGNIPPFCIEDIEAIQQTLSSIGHAGCGLFSPPLSMHLANMLRLAPFVPGSHIFNISNAGGERTVSNMISAPVT